MARQRKGILDGFNGSVAHVTGRKMYGKSFISKKQGKRNVELTETQKIQLIKMRGLWQAWNSASLTLSLFLFKVTEQGLSKHQQIVKSWMSNVSSSGRLTGNPDTFMPGNILPFIGSGYVNKVNATTIRIYKSSPPNSSYPTGTVLRLVQIYSVTENKFISTLRSVTSAPAFANLSGIPFVVGHVYMTISFISINNQPYVSQIKASQFTFPA